MTVAVPHTRLHPACAQALGDHAPGHRRYRIDPDDPGAYATVLANLWAEGRYLVVVEHDIAIHAGVLPQFLTCPQPWCGFVYPLPGGVVDAALGCTRFRADLLIHEPDAVLDAATRADDLPAGHWAHLDAHLRTVLETRGYSLHRHYPPVAHHRPYPQS